MDSATVGLLQGVLESEGIPTFYRNQALSSTEAVIPAFYPALCVMRDEDVSRAKDLIKSTLHRGATEGPELADQFCPSCGETNPGSFEICWNCEVELEKTG